ncbi:MAG TPA: hypothetical protein PLC06_12960, partial [Promineifilum sp.]|nr:hypothetical protein [Promineifilum sp.]
MFARYIITILPTGETLPHPVADESGTLRLELPGRSVTIETPDAVPDTALVIRHEPDQITITEGYPIPATTGGLPHS